MYSAAIVYGNARVCLSAESWQYCDSRNLFPTLVEYGNVHLAHIKQITCLQKTTRSLQSKTAEAEYLNTIAKLIK